jgi:stage V sporulation protein SpoVS
MRDEKENVTDGDETLLLVSGSKKRTKEEEKQYVKKLANAVTQVYGKHEMARLRCCGAASLNNAIKSFIIAKEEIKKGGTSLRADFAFTNVEFKGESKTGILIEVTEDNCDDTY